MGSWGTEAQAKAQKEGSAGAEGTVLLVGKRQERRGGDSTAKREKAKKRIKGSKIREKEETEGKRAENNQLLWKKRWEWRNIVGGYGNERDRQKMTPKPQDGKLHIDELQSNRQHDGEMKRTKRCEGVGVEDKRWQKGGRGENWIERVRKISEWKKKWKKENGGRKKTEIERERGTDEWNVLTCNKLYNVQGDLRKVRNKK